MEKVEGEGKWRIWVAAGLSQSSCCCCLQRADVPCVPGTTLEPIGATVSLPRPQPEMVGLLFCTQGATSSSGFPCHTPRLQNTRIFVNLWEQYNSAGTTTLGSGSAHTQLFISDVW